jgi:hypothetical protein
LHLILSKIQTNEFSRKIITKPYLNIYSVIALFIVDFFHDLLTGQQLITIFIQLSFLKKKIQRENGLIRKEIKIPKIQLHVCIIYNTWYIN